jgi:hypothetical protein
MKIIFLDIDGVLVNRASFRLPRIQCEKYTATYCAAHPVCVENLNHIVTETGAKMVISSVWRMYGISTMRELFKHWGVAATIIGKTPDLVHAENGIHIGVERGHEIQAWMDSYTRNPIESFVIIDDDSDMNGLRHRLIRTEFEDGLTEANAERAIKMLNIGE